MGLKYMQTMGVGLRLWHWAFFVVLVAVILYFSLFPFPVSTAHLKSSSDILGEELRAPGAGAMYILSADNIIGIRKHMRCFAGVESEIIE